MTSRSALAIDTASRPWLSWARAPGAVVLTALAATAAWLLRDYSMDDSFITFRYARNLADGLGFVFNAGERVQGTTTPLFTGVMTLVHLLGLEAQSAALWLSMAGFLGAALLVYERLGRRGSRLGGFIAGALIVGSPLALLALTMETGLYVFLLVLFFELKERQHDRAAAAAAAALFLTRFDGILLFPLAVLRARDLRPSWPSLAIVSLPAAAWLLFARLYFGSFLPATFGAKQRMTSLALDDSQFIRGLVHWSTMNAGGTLLAVGFALLTAVGIVLELRRSGLRAWPVAWMGAYTAGYFVINPSWVFHWYFTPVVVVAILLQGNVAAWAATSWAGSHWAGTRRADPQQPTATAVGSRSIVRGVASLAAISWLVLALWSAQTAWLKHWRTSPTLPHRHVAAYLEMSEYIRAHSCPDDRVAASEIGVVGYFTEREIIDLVGLTDPEIAQRVREVGRGGVGREVIFEQRPAYLVANASRGWGSDMAAKPKFQALYREAVAGRKGRDRVVLFERRDLRGRDVTRCSREPAAAR